MSNPPKGLQLDTAKPSCWRDVGLDLGELKLQCTPGVHGVHRQPEHDFADHDAQRQQRRQQPIERQRRVDFSAHAPIYLLQGYSYLFLLGQRLFLRWDWWIGLLVVYLLALRSRSRDYVPKVFVSTLHQEELLPPL